MAETQWMTLLETADMMKRLPIQVTRMCEDGKLEYYMEDGRYFVSRESIDLFMHPSTGGPAPANPDTNGTPRRRYGRAPDDFEPSSATAAEMEAVNGRDETGAAGEAESDNIAEEAPRTGDEKVKAWEDTATPEAANELMYVAAPEDVAASEDVAAPEIANVPAEAREDVAPPEAANDTMDVEAREDEKESQAAGQLQEGGQAEPVDEAAQTDETLLHHGAGTETPIQEEDQAASQGQEQAVSQETDQAASVVNPDDANMRAVEIIADLRTAIARHAMEHKAFCDEIACLADALESTLSQDDDKTSELTREISSLLARYTRR